MKEEGRPRLNPPQYDFPNLPQLNSPTADHGTVLNGAQRGKLGKRCRLGKRKMDEKRTKKIRSVRDLKVYRKAFDSAMEIFEITKKFPKEETYSLTDQIRRASRSVCSNLSEKIKERENRKEERAMECSPIKHFSDKRERLYFLIPHFSFLWFWVRWTSMRCGKHKNDSFSLINFIEKPPRSDSIPPGLRLKIFKFFDIRSKVWMVS